MSEVSPDRRAVRAEAAAWLARLRADDRTEDDARAFRAWIEADAAHAAAFEAISAMWEIAGSIPRDLRGLPVRHPSGNRRQIMAGAGLCVVGAGVFAAWQSAEAGVYQTDVGEQKHVVLDDGSQVFLDTDTRLRVAFSKTLRSASLDYGRASFHVTPIAKRPFEVRAAKRKVLATSSVFDVRRDGERVSVVIVRGSVALSPESGAQTEILHTGQRLIAEDRNVGLDRPNLEPLLAWHTGRAIFENEKLDAAAREMNRYSTTKITIDDDRISGLRVSGMYSVGDNLAFANSVARLLPVRVRESDNQVHLFSDPDRAGDG